MKRFVAALILACSLAVPASAQERMPLPADQPYVHGPSAMTFPLSVGAYQRATMGVRYLPDGTNESVGYRLTTPRGHVQATIYIYPSPDISTGATAGANLAEARQQNCATQFNDLVTELSTVHTRANVLENGAAQLMQNGAAQTGHHYVFTVDAPSAFGDTHPTLRSEAHLFCYVGGRWTVKYRFTYAAELQAEADIAGFMRDLAWTIPPEGA